MSYTSNFRGGYAPRTGRGGWSKPFTKPREYVKPDVEKHPLGELLKTFRNSDLRVETDNPSAGSAISDVQYVASYNWLSDETPTILVPGKPPQWTPLKYAQRLKEDSGKYYRDPNAARYPEHPIAPVVQAILDCKPNFPTAQTDIVACGSTLGNLLRFVRGQDRAFRFSVETIGNTVFLVRKENDPKEIIANVRGFGHSFPEAYTHWEREVGDSETHQRIVQYEFGGFTCLVRFECDGYIKPIPSASDAKINDPNSPKNNEKKAKNTNDDESDLLATLNKTTITQPSTSKVLSSECVVVKSGGSVIPQSCIFDLKTRSGKYQKDIDMGDIYPQLWIKQIPNFIVAYHDGAGLFEDIRVQDICKNVNAWEKENTVAIRRLAMLLEKIVAFAREDQGLLEVYSPSLDCLEIRKQCGEGKRALPSRLRDEWVSQSGKGMQLLDSDDDGYKLDRGYDSEQGWNPDSDEDEPDYTACSAEDCGYCGKCTY